MKPETFHRLRFLLPLAVLAFVALLTFVFQRLWNGVLADVLAVKAISYWQALGLLLLAKILFGGWPHGGHRLSSRLRERMMAKHWESIDPEQRTKMREEMRRRFGDWPRPPWCDEPPGKAGGDSKP